MTVKTLTNREQAIQYANKQLEYHGLYQCGWRFKIDTAKSRLGHCRYHLHEIAISEWILNDMAAVYDTILHEIAHALVGPFHGHNKVWKAKCIEIGANPERTGTAQNIADEDKGAWRSVCSNCGHEHHMHRKTNRMTDKACTKCKPAPLKKRRLIMWENKKTGEVVSLENPRSVQVATWIGTARCCGTRSNKGRKSKNMGRYVCACEPCQKLPISKRAIDWHNTKTGKIILSRF